MWSVLYSWCQGKVDGTELGVVLFRFSENSVLMDDIFEKIFNEELNKLLLEKNQNREDKTWVQHGDPEFEAKKFRTRIDWVAARAWISKATIIEGQSMSRSTSRKLCKKLLRNWRIEKTLISGRKYWKTRKIGIISYAACSGITNSESILSRSWFTEQLWRTHVPHQALITSSSKKSTAAKLECREVHERIWVFLETFLIANMLNEILMNYTMIQEIWRYHWRFWEQKELRIVGAQNHCNQYLYLAFQWGQGETI